MVQHLLGEVGRPAVANGLGRDAGRAPVEEIPLTEPVTAVGDCETAPSPDTPIPDSAERNDPGE